MMRSKATHVGESGFAIIYIIISIVIVSIIGAAITRISSSSVLSEVELTQLNNARYLAESGIQYAQGLAASYKKQSKTIAETVTALNQNGGTVTVPGAGTFTLSAAQNGSNILVTSTGHAKSGLANHQLPLTVSIVYASASNASTSDVLKGIYSGISANLSGGGTFDGSYATSQATVYGGVKITGSLTDLNTSSTCLNISNGVSVGTAGANTYVCSDTCVVISGGSIINGNVYSQGNVTINSGSQGPINGSIYSMGKVTITGGSTVNGNVYAQGDISVLGGSTVKGSIYSGGNVILDWPGSSPDVTGDIYAVGTLSLPQWAIPSQFYKGQFSKLSSSSSIPKPSLCSSYTLPPHETVPTTMSLPSFGWGTGQVATYTFYGKPDISDHSYSIPSFNVPGGIKVCFDLSTPGTYINIFDSGNLNFNGVLYVRTSTSTNCFDNANQVFKARTDLAAASRVYMDVRGSVNTGGGTGWFGTIYAGGSIQLTGNHQDNPAICPVYAGALYTNQRFNPGGAGGVDTIFVASDYVNKYWP